MVERFATGEGCLNEDGELFAQAVLATKASSVRGRRSSSNSCLDEQIRQSLLLFYRYLAHAVDITMASSGTILGRRFPSQFPYGQRDEQVPARAHQRRPAGRVGLAAHSQLLER